MSDFKFIDLFAGIGGIKTGFMNAGFECIYSNDIDSHENTAYQWRRKYVRENKSGVCLSVY